MSSSEFDFVVQSDFEKWLDKKAGEAANVLAVGETNMIFKEAYPDLSEWRFHRLTRLNKNVVGLDVVRGNVLDAKKAGYDFRLADVESEDDLRSVLHHEEFDLILLLDVTEHLGNPGRALVNLRRHLSKDGIIVVSTPSPWYFRDIMQIAGGNEAGVYEDHVNFIVPLHMQQLSQRAHLRCTISTSFNSNPQASKIQRILLAGLKRYNWHLMNHYVYILKRDY